MSLFNFGKKKEDKPCSCCCNGAKQVENDSNSQSAQKSGSSVKVLGSGCAKCNALEAATVEALKELGMNCEVDHVTDFAQIAAYGVMSTPALVINEKVVSFGKVLKKDEVIAILKKLD